MTSPSHATSAASLTARRVQYRVGHGGFHATFVNPGGPTPNRLTYVYDLGAKPSKHSHLLPAIATFSQELTNYGIDQVEYVFLSHIDEDHVNGLQEFLAELKSCTPRITVKNVMLPWLSPIQKLITQSRNNGRQPSAAVSILASDDEQADVYLRGLGVENVVRITAEGEDGAPARSSTTHSAGNPIAGATPFGWVIQPVKTPTPKGFEALFRTALRNLLPQSLDPNNIANHQAILATHQSSIKAAMRSVAAQVGVRQKAITNWSSLAILHGSGAASKRCIFTGITTSHFDVDCTHGWVHTGDLPLNEAAVWSNLSQELSSSSIRLPLCTVVAPHHGSGRDHNDLLYDLTQPSAVILTTGRKLSGPNVRKPSYSYNLGLVHAKITQLSATPVDLHN